MRIKKFEGFTDWFKSKDTKPEVGKDPEGSQKALSVSKKVLIELNKNGYHMRPIDHTFIAKGNKIPMSDKLAPFDWIPFKIEMDGQTWDSGLCIYFKYKDGEFSYVKHSFRSEENKDEEYAEKLISEIDSLYRSLS